MYSTRKHSGTEKSSDQECERKGLTLNLAVCGSPVPIYSQQPKTLREYKMCKHASKERKGKENEKLPFPVDKIIYLTERLEFTSLTEKKIKSVSLSEVNIKAKNSLEKVEKEVIRSRKNSGNQEKMSNEVLPPGFDFSLDLSSVVSTGDDSDESCSESVQTPFYSDNEPPCISLSEKETGETTRTTNSDSDESPFEFYGNRACAICDECESTKNSSCDLIKVYVNSVNNQELVKFLRLCRICKEPCCICRETPAGKYTYPEESSVSYFLENARDRCCTFRKIDRGNQTIRSEAHFSCKRSGCPLLRKRPCCSEFCCGEIFEADFCKSFCGRESNPVSHVSSDGSLEPDRMLAYSSSLANAAKSARILARDLEIILSTLNGESE